MLFFPRYEISVLPEINFSGSRHVSSRAEMHARIDIERTVHPVIIPSQFLTLIRYFRIESFPPFGPPLNAPTVRRACFPGGKRRNCVAVIAVFVNMDHQPGFFGRTATRIFYHYPEPSFGTADTDIVRMGNPDLEIRQRFDEKCLRQFVI
jgi:hypothetical protein